jgi:hypothetical protein
MRFARATASDLLGRTTTALRLPGMQTAQLPRSVGRTTRFCSGIVVLLMGAGYPSWARACISPVQPHGPSEPARALLCRVCRG